MLEGSQTLQEVLEGSALLDSWHLPPHPTPASAGLIPHSHPSETASLSHFLFGFFCLSVSLVKMPVILLDVNGGSGQFSFKYNFSN